MVIPMATFFVFNATSTKKIVSDADQTFMDLILCYIFHNQLWIKLMRKRRKQNKKKLRSFSKEKSVEWVLNLEKNNRARRLLWKEDEVGHVQYKIEEKR